ncbi:MAG: thiamine-monophosphate kinase [Phycisphaerales bacterium]|jgi:thiamine-monophosphate kinase|nr:thiamine-monophosphate kinase [Phycisphaerales bacterium]
MAGEFDFIEWVRRQTARRDEHVLVPPGDDLAVLKWSADDLLIVGVDQVLDGVHFDSAVHTPRDIGRKVMNRNLSDCAAMACLPAAAVATVALPKTRDIEYAKELFLGMKAAADVFDFPIVGGDTASWDAPLAMTVTILGRSSSGIPPITRNTAKPGDSIYVTGPLGGSILGRHMTFIPRVREARQLAQSGLVTSMIDISDGLSRDLRHICRESGVGAALHSSEIPIHPDADTLSRQTCRYPIEHALHDGEDYELLFTTSAEQPYGYWIGTITAETSIIDEDGAISLEPKGWEHKL